MTGSGDHSRRVRGAGVAEGRARSVAGPDVDRGRRGGGADAARHRRGTRPSRAPRRHRRGGGAARPRTNWGWLPHRRSILSRRRERDCCARATTTPALAPSASRIAWPPRRRDAWMHRSPPPIPRSSRPARRKGSRSSRSPTARAPSGPVPSRRATFAGRRAGILSSNGAPLACCAQDRRRVTLRGARLAPASESPPNEAHHGHRSHAARPHERPAEDALHRLPRLLLRPHPRADRGAHRGRTHPA